MASLLTLALLYLAALIIPGPNMILLTHTAASRSRRAAVGVALGISVGTLMWVSIAVFGMQQVFSAAPMLQTALKLVGGLYLIYLALVLFRDAKRTVSVEDASIAVRSSWRDDFRRGLLTNVTNPKSLAFWSSVAVVSIDPSASLAWQLASVALVAVMGLGWHIGVAYLFSTPRAQAIYLRAKPILARVTAVVMLFFGGRLLWSLRT